MGKGVWGKVALSLALVAVGPSVARAEETTVQIPAYALPPSSFLSGETRAALDRYATIYRPSIVAAAESCKAVEGRAGDKGYVAAMRALRTCRAEAFQRTDYYRKAAERYPVSIEARTMDGVATEIFTPAGGISPDNERRVLINLHGGGFQNGGGTTSRLESMPIASVGKIRVVSVDYRMGPEHAFPAASEDVTAVYRELLKTYEPRNIGIYGCSAGGLLTAEAIAWFQKQKLPLPGAIGMFCAGASYWGEGDAGYNAAALFGMRAAELNDPRENPYFKGAHFDDPLVFPILSPAVMRRFPPSLLLTGTRDFALSSVAATQTALSRQGVEAELHLWEGMNHAFLYNPELPESREAYDVIVRFFRGHLGR